MHRVAASRVARRVHGRTQSLAGTACSHRLRSLEASMPCLAQSVSGVSDRQRRRMSCVSVQAPAGGDQVLTLETGDVARLADGAVMATQGNATVLATAVSSPEVGEGNTFLPLTVEYQEKFYSFGQIPLSRNRREPHMPTDHEILGSRVVDRTLRPLFPADYFCETQVITKLLSYDPHVDPEALAINAASSVLGVSSIPFKGPAGAVRVGWSDGQPVLHPSRRDLATSELDLLYAGTRDKAVMVEVAASQLSEDALREAFSFAHSHLGALIDVQEDLRAQTGKPVQRYETLYPSSDVLAATSAAFLDDAKQFWRTDHTSKSSRSVAQAKLFAKIVEDIGGMFPDASAPTLELAGDLLLERAMRDVIIESVAHRETAVAVPQGLRIDGRGVDDVRSLVCKPDVLRKPHGSALFSRGDTQTLCTVTLGPPHTEAAAMSVDLQPKSFFLHYDFPPYCVNEVGKLGTNRRMVGHGALAEKAIARVMPSTEELAYAVRANSEVTASDGSSSMATVCGTSLALLDAGIQVPHVGGISVGLVTPLDDNGAPVEGEKSVLLTDILGLEDHFGDMDFKVAGTRQGVTAVQLDIKLNGVPLDVLFEALDKAKAARGVVLDAMESAMPEPRPSLKDTAPQLHLLPIDESQRHAFIGQNAANLRAIEAATGVSLALEDLRSIVKVWAPSPAAFEEAKDAIHSLLHPPMPVRVGTVYRATVVDVLDFGLKLEIAGLADTAKAGSPEEMACIGCSGFLHISMFAHDRTNSFTATRIIDEGDELVVMAVDVDGKGSAFFSRKDVPGPMRGDIIRAQKDTSASGSQANGSKGDDSSPNHDNQGKGSKKKPRATAKHSKGGSKRKAKGQ